MFAIPSPLPPEGAATSTRRCRELYKYFIPPGSSFSTAQDTVPDTVLTAHAQLVAWRLNAQRAMISLIDKDVQYFVAESTKTLHLNDSTQSDDPDDAIWAGCVQVPMAGRLCEHTIRAVPPPGGGPAFFEVRDLEQDPRFNQLPFVTAPPHFRYYCGVPLRSKRDVNIGSFFILDDHVRDPIDPVQVQFLQIMAENVLSHLESLTEKAERKRALNMNMCLAAYVDPEHATRKRKRRLASRSTPAPRVAQSSAVHSTRVEEGEASLDPLDLPPLGAVEDSLQQPASGRPSSTTSHRSALRSKAGSKRSKSLRSSGGSDSEGDTDPNRVEESEYVETFQRAADLLVQALDMDKGSGLVFMDSSAARGTFRANSIEQDDYAEDLGSDMGTDHDRSTPPGSRSEASRGSRKGAIESKISVIRSPLVEVIASAGPGGLPSNDPSFRPLSQNDLFRLVKRHPRGKLFNLESDHHISTSSGGEAGTDDPYNMPRSKRVTPSHAEAKVLSAYFPAARQIIFLPLWDPSSSRFSAFFAYNTSEYRTFGNNPDFLFCIAFCNCLMTDLMRLTTEAADQQKSDFIGSISHELRSPLHGILASCEFLAETETDSFQRSLIDTADSCGKTLLDTIEQILDYSKINAFERNAEKAKKSRRRDRLGAQTLTRANSFQPTLSIYGTVDLAAITEEVVEGVATGQSFKDTHSTDTTAGAFEGVNQVKTYKNVDIILDISAPKSRNDWTFVTQPGAFRRICMNLVGNSLKYTSSGHVHVTLRAEERDSSVTMIKLVVTDTGRGMSPAFLRSKLFVPFAQENVLSSGTGLGLSIIRILVDTLGGHIDVRSSLGVGTQVTVEIPMKPPGSSQSGNSSAGSSQSTQGSSDKTRNDLISNIRHCARGRRVLLWPPLPKDTTIPEHRQLMRAAATRYAGDWYDLKVIDQYSPDSPPDIIFTNEELVPAMMRELPDLLTQKLGPVLVVTCAPANKGLEKAALLKSANAEVLSHPFGPFKLAKVVKLSLDKLDRRAIPEGVIDNPVTVGAENAATEDTDEVARAVEKLSLVNPTDPNGPPIQVVKRGEVFVGEDSVHAQLVTQDDLPSDSTSSGSDQVEYPFPTPESVMDLQDGTITPSNLEGERPPLTARRTISVNRKELTANEPAEGTAMSSAGVIATAPPTTAPIEPTEVQKTREPRLLLVDDNAINLRLLQTFMKKRKFTDIHSAEDGLQAVNAYSDMLLNQTLAYPPDIIFMDISMPIMNGFEATRKIREVEAKFRESLPPMQTPPSTLIIALTGLASGRDQSEAFTSGFDLYLVKPISFKEVGRLLDNWQRNGGAATVGIPHGAVSQGDAAT